MARQTKFRQGSGQQNENRILLHLSFCLFGSLQPTACLFTDAQTMVNSSHVYIHLTHPRYTILTPVIARPPPSWLSLALGLRLAGSRLTTQCMEMQMCTRAFAPPWCECTIWPQLSCLVCIGGLARWLHPCPSFYRILCLSHPSPCLACPNKLLFRSVYLGDTAKTTCPQPPPLTFALLLFPYHPSTWGLSSRVSCVACSYFFGVFLFFLSCLVYLTYRNLARSLCSPAMIPNSTPPANPWA